MASYIHFPPPRLRKAHRRQLNLVHDVVSHVNPLRGLAVFILSFLQFFSLYKAKDIKNNSLFANN